MSRKDKLERRFVQDRDRAFTAFVLHDDWGKVLWFMRKYHINPHPNELVMKAGILKGVQECVNIPDDVKGKAAAKCIALGFTPFFKDRREGESHADGTGALPGGVEEDCAGGEDGGGVEVSAVREAVPETRGTLRHAQEHTDGGPPEPPAGGLPAGESESAVRSVPSEV